MKTITATKLSRGNLEATYNLVSAHNPVKILNNQRHDIVMIDANDYGDMVAELDKFKWYCVHDLTPAPETAVLAANKNQVNEMWFNHKSKFDLPRNDGFTDDYDLHFIKGITHWMPMPKLNN